jgi:biopolymer transport protein TolR
MSGGGGEEPNLTPFIDLFSVLICFLLMTTAWLQLDSLQVGIQPAKDKVSNNPDTPPEPTPAVKKAELSVAITPTAVVIKEDLQKNEIPKLNGVVDRSSVMIALETLKAKYPDRNDMKVETEAGVLYGEMIGIYDLLLETKWPEVGISTQ